ncbi:MAG: hypothetical protein FWH27_01745 [Planctomycetaceae bacterium]|nr:hypothetical protein [Planctomycetaceae bacterium]
MSFKTKQNVTKKIQDKRKKRELSSAEYETFVTHAAKQVKAQPEKLVTVDRRYAKPAITGQPVAEQTALPDANKNRRRKIQRRRQIDPTTCERDYSQEEIEFMNALDVYKRNSGRMFPTCCEILEVFRNLGYAKQSSENSTDTIVNPKSGDVDLTANETNAVYGDDETRQNWLASFR